MRTAKQYVCNKERQKLKIKSWRMRTPRRDGQRGERRNRRMKTKGKENFTKGVTDLTNDTGSYERVGQKSVNSN